jgi:hypothetical protein
VYPLPLHDGIRTALNIDNKIIVKILTFKLSFLHTPQKHYHEKLFHLALPKTDKGKLKQNKKTLTLVTAFINYYTQLYAAMES